MNKISISQLVTKSTMFFELRNKNTVKRLISIYLKTRSSISTMYYSNYGQTNGYNGDIMCLNKCLKN